MSVWMSQQLHTHGNKHAVISYFFFNFHHIDIQNVYAYTLFASLLQTAGQIMQMLPWESNLSLSIGQGSKLTWTLDHPRL